MKVKYRVSDKKVLEVQKHPTHLLEAGPDEAIDEIQDTKNIFAGMTRMAEGDYRGKTQQELDQEERAKKTARRTRKRALVKKLGLNAAEIKTLRELVEDGNQD